MSFLSKIFNPSRFRDKDELFQYIIKGLEPLVDEWIKEFKNQNKEYLIINFILHRHTQWHLNAFIYAIIDFNNTPVSQNEIIEMQQRLVRVWEALFSELLPEGVDLFNQMADIKKELLNPKYDEGDMKSEYMSYTMMAQMQAAEIYWEMGDSNSNFYNSYRYDAQKVLVNQEKNEIAWVKGGYRSFLKPNLAKIFLNEK